VGVKVDKQSTNDGKEGIISNSGASSEEKSMREVIIGETKQASDWDRDERSSLGTGARGMMTECRWD
jgi:hypothetical protein